MKPLGASLRALRSRRIFGRPCCGSVQTRRPWLFGCPMQRPSLEPSMITASASMRWRPCWPLTCSLGCRMERRAGWRQGRARFGIHLQQQDPCLHGRTTPKHPQALHNAPAQRKAQASVAGSPPNTLPAAATITAISDQNEVRAQSSRVMKRAPDALK